MSAQEIDDFPYKRNYGNMLREISERFCALMKYRAQFVPVRDYRIANAPDFDTVALRFVPWRGPYLMQLHAANYLDYDLVTDYFIEQVRIRAYRGDDPSRESVYDYWCANRDQIKDICARTVAREDMEHCAREFIYKNKMEVGTFRPTVALGIFQLMRNHLREKCDTVLNPCAGWGDRLIAAMAGNIRAMISVDPNIELAPQYDRMIQWAQSQIETRAQVARNKFAHETIVAPFEDIPTEDIRAKLAHLMHDTTEGIIAGSQAQEFDLALIAPPYFDLEVYVAQDTRGTQSISRYATFESWYSSFLIPLVLKCASLLRKKGIIALIINQAPTARTDPQARFLRRMIRDISNNGVGKQTAREIQLRYLGPISYAEISRGRIRSPQPIWFWQRL